MSITLTETATKGTGLIVPEDGVDLRKAETVQVPFQAAANRHKWAENHIDALEAVGLPTRLASDHFAYGTPKTRTVFVPASAFVPQTTNGWRYSGLGWISLVDSAVLDGDLTPYIPAGATVSKITSVYNSGSVQLAAVSVQHRLSKYAFAVVGNAGTNVNPWSQTSTTGWVLGFGDDGFTQNVEVNAPTGCNPLNAIDTKANALLLEVKASDDGAANPDVFYGVTISLTNDTYASNY